MLCLTVGGVKSETNTASFQHTRLGKQTASRLIISLLTVWTNFVLGSRLLLENAKNLTH